MKPRDQILSEFLQLVSETRSPKTHKTYAQALKTFVELVGDAELSTETFIKFLRKTNSMNPATQALYCSAVMSLYLYASQYNEVNLAALKQAKRQYAQQYRKSPPEIDRESIEKIIAHCETMRNGLEELRDRAFVLTLADTGLRISEACNLKRGDIDWHEGRAIIIGKRKKKRIVRFSDRSMRAIKDYIAARASLDGQSSKPLPSLPLFSRHDRPAGGKIRKIQSGGMWLAIKKRMKEAGVDPGNVRIHDFRHYFVTIFYLGSHDLLATKEAARHESSDTTSGYTHLLPSYVDEIYDKVINRRQDWAKT